MKKYGHVSNISLKEETNTQWPLLVTELINRTEVTEKWIEKKNLEKKTSKRNMLHSSHHYMLIISSSKYELLFVQVSILFRNFYEVLSILQIILLINLQIFT